MPEALQAEEGEIKKVLLTAASLPLLLPTTMVPATADVIPMSPGTFTFWPLGR